jgi:hypothetical protein
MGCWSGDQQRLRGDQQRQNAGHYFGDKLTDAERKALSEYLKTL